MEKTSVLVATVLLNALWQVAAIAALAAICARGMRNAPARYHHTLWVAALALAVVLPLAGGPKPWAGSEAAPAPLVRAFGSADAASIVGGTEDPATWEPSLPATPAPTPQPPIPTPRSIHVAPSTLFAITACYLIFLAIRLAGLFRALKRTRAIRREAHAASLPTFLTLCASRCQAALGLAEVSVLCSTGLSVPLTVGARRPVIVLPESLVRSATADELTSAVGHELAHIRRGDFALNALCELLYVPISFHPAAVLIRRKIIQTRELACDEMVIERLVDPFTYASSLVRIASSLHTGRGTGYGVGVLDGGILEERIRRLIDRTPRASAHTARLGLAAASGALILFGAGASTFSLRVTRETAVENPRQEVQVAAGHVSAAVGASAWSVYDLPDEERMDTRAHPATVGTEPTGSKPTGTRAQPAVKGTHGGTTIERATVPPPIEPPLDLTSLTARIHGGQIIGGEIDPIRDALLVPPPAPLVGPRLPASYPVLAAPSGPVRMVRQSTSVTTFRLKGFEDAGIVTLAGSFNDWDPSAQQLAREGDEWVCRLELPPGKYTYKFVVDGEWMTDPSNPFWEKDGRGNTNSNLNVRSVGQDARYVTFTLDGFGDAETVVLAGSFNDWHRSRQRMVRENDQWVCRVKLEPGKHFYKFIVDGEWMTDPANRATEDDGKGNTNSVLMVGS